jgi:outer membrane protein insertion porin family
VLVAEVVINGAQGQLEDEIFRVINTRPGRATTRSQLQADVNAIFATGYFASVDVLPEDTPLGVRVTFVVQANPVLRNVVVNTVPEGVGTPVLPQSVVDNIFSEQYGQILNLRQLQEGIKRLNQWYKENGYDLAQVIDAQQVTADGRVTLVVAEGVVEDIRVRFLDKEGEATNEQGEPVRGRTRNFIITREVQLKPGDVFNRQTAQNDLRRVFGLGIFDDVRLSFAPGTDPRKVVVVVDVIEKNTGSLAAGAGISSASGLFGSVSYQQQNLGGNNQTLGAELQAGVRELLFDASFTDPWIAGDPYRTSYTVSVFRRRSISLIFDGGTEEVELPNGDRPRVRRTGGGISFTRPLSRDVFTKADWTASLGLQYQRVSIRDNDGELSPEDELGNDLSFSGEGKDDLLTVQLGAVRDRRNNLLRPTQGSLLRLGVEQSIPIGQGNILLTRLRGSYSYYIPVNFTSFTKALRPLPLTFKGGLSWEICRLMKPFPWVALARCGVTMREMLGLGAALSRRLLNIASRLSQWWAALCLLTLPATLVQVATYRETPQASEVNQAAASATVLASGYSRHSVRFGLTMVLMTKVTAVSTLALGSDSNRVATQNE